MSETEEKEEKPKAETETEEKDGEAKEEKEEEVDLENLPMTDVTDPRESDVLCGRGGAALRHPGNQTYRRLVNLNKQLYITCLKTEKLKISRSIVAAIREQHGRFLERDTKKGTWFDIGDKKAIEKTSQALREGQPKLRQKMIANGQIPPDSNVSIEQQFSNGIYNPRSGPNPNAVAGGFPDGTNGMSDMPPPPSRTLSNEMSASMTPDMMMQRLSLIGPNSIPSWTPSVNSNASMGGSQSLRGPGSIPSWTPSYASHMSTMSDARSIRSRLRPSLTPRGSGVADELGMPNTNLSVLSDYSAYGANPGGGGNMMNNNNNNMGNMGPPMDNRFQMEFEIRPEELNNYHQQQMNGNSNAPPPPPPPPAMSPMLDSPSLSTSADRRRLFARMKYQRNAGGRNRGSQRSVGDGMPDIHMVDSSFSLLSNTSGHGKDPLSFSNHMGSSEHSNSMGLGSRRSLMSGLSKISDSSDACHSVFSDMSKKFNSNLSNRSIAMSEMSGIEDFHEEGDLEDTFAFDQIK